MVKHVMLMVTVILLISCTSKTTNDEAGSVVDSDGFTTSTLSSGKLSLRWRVVNNTTLDAALIGDPSGEGWIAVGFGKSVMSGAKIILVQNGSDGTQFSTATGFNFGLNSSEINLSDTAINVAGTEITASFNVSLADINVSAGESTSIIWAYKTVTQTVQSDVSTVGQHSARGSTSITFQ